MNFFRLLFASTVLSLALLFASPSPASADFTLTAIDVGYGSAIHVEADFNHFLFDVGPSTGVKNVLSHLSRVYAASLAAVFLTHTHPDHVGGLFFLQGRYPFQKVFWNDRLPPDEDVVTSLDAVQNIVDFSFLKNGVSLALSKHIVLETLPNDLDNPGLNDDSLAFLIREGKRKALIPGDIEIARQKNIAKVARKKIRRPDIFIWPHHGDELAEEFFDALDKVKICVISVGKNDYGLPKPKALTQAETLCSELYFTNEVGTISFAVNKRGAGRIELTEGVR